MVIGEGIIKIDFLKISFILKIESINRENRDSQLNPSEQVVYILLTNCV